MATHNRQPMLNGTAHENGERVGYTLKTAREYIDQEDPPRLKWQTHREAVQYVCGYTNETLEEIADRTGISKPTLHEAVWKVLDALQLPVIRADGTPKRRRRSPLERNERPLNDDDNNGEKLGKGDEE